MKVVIAGNYKSVYFLAKSFLEKKYDVTVINKNLGECKKLSKELEVLVVNGDASKSYVLEDADVYNADILIALTSKDCDNLVICELAKKVYDVTKTVSIVNSARNIDVFQELGVDTAVSYTYILTNLIERYAYNDERVNFIPIDEDQFILSKVIIDRDSEICGKKISDIMKFSSTKVCGLIRGGVSTLPKDDIILQDGDAIIVFSLRDKEVGISSLARRKK